MWLSNVFSVSWIKVVRHLGDLISKVIRKNLIVLRKTLKGGMHIREAY